MLYLDTNQDSFVSRSEMDALKQLSGGIMDDNMLNMMFALMDTNRDQLVSWAEAYSFALANDDENGYRGALSFATKDE